MKSFSERMGLEPNKVGIQRESISNELRNALWNALYLCYFAELKEVQYSYLFVSSATKQLFNYLWMDYYHQNVDISFTSIKIYDMVKEDVISGNWNKTLDILEFIPNHYWVETDQEKAKNKTNLEFFSMCNYAFEKHLSAYKFVDAQITEITSEEEIATIEDSLDNRNGFAPAQQKLKSALELYSNRINPDYTNSIKDSISAVESYCSFIANGDKKFSKAIAKVDSKYKLHSRLKDAFSALFDYTSDGNIRHGSLEESNLRQEDAKFMLVTCSAFINYLVVKIASHK